MAYRGKVHNEGLIWYKANYSIHISLLKPFDGKGDKVHVESFINYFTDVVSWR